jgi:hypothetical protein
LSECAFVKPNGERCASRAMKSYEHCYNHRPDLSEERSRNASKGGKTGGRGRPAAELASIKKLLEDLTSRVLGDAGAPQRLDTGRAAVANQLINTRLRAIELARKIKETDELAARLERLERAQAPRRGR